MRHVSKEQLKQVSTHGIIDGFNLVCSKNDKLCKCETCAMAKIRRHASERTKCVDAPKRIWEHVSSDVKSVPYESIVDHYSRYFMRKKKSEVLYSLPNLRIMVPSRASSLR